MLILTWLVTHGDLLACVHLAILVAALGLSRKRLTGAGRQVRDESFGRRRWESLRQRVSPTGIALIAWLFVPGEIGRALATGELVRLRHSTRSLAITSLPGVAMALATPLRRHGMLRMLGEVLDERRDPELIALNLRAALRWEPADHSRVASMWIAHGELERGAALAEEFGDWRLASQAWYAMGDFQRASAAWAKDDFAATQQDLFFGATAALLAGDLHQAEAALHRIVSGLEGDTKDAGCRARAYDAMCLAQAIGARSGREEAVRALSRTPDVPLSQECAALRADLSIGAERIRIIQAMRQFTSPTSYDWLTLLAAEADPARELTPTFPFEGMYGALALVVPEGRAFERALPAVERRLSDELSAVQTPSKLVRTSRAQVLVPAALFAVVAGDYETARAFADKRDQDVTALRGIDLSKENANADLRAVVSTFDPDVAAAPFAAELIALTPSDGRRLVHALLGIGLCHVESAYDLMNAIPPQNEQEKHSWTLAARDDIRALVQWLRRGNGSAGVFLRFAVRPPCHADKNEGSASAQQHRAELGQWLRWGYREAFYMQPIAELVQLENRAVAATALGDDALARTFRARAERFRQAILRRETSILLGALSQLGRASHRT